MTRRTNLGVLALNGHRMFAVICWDRNFGLQFRAFTAVMAFVHLDLHCEDIIVIINVNVNVYVYGFR